MVALLLTVAAVAGLLIVADSTGADTAIPPTCSWRRTSFDQALWRTDQRPRQPARSALPSRFDQLEADGGTGRRAAQDSVGVQNEVDYTTDIAGPVLGHEIIAEADSDLLSHLKVGLLR